ncbi:MAG: T9SS type A sorting domain-containing protein [Bacteroidota bacterium]
MKKHIFLFLICVFSLSLNAQTFLISTGDSATTCSGTFFDSNAGISGNYNDNEDFTFTFKSATPFSNPRMRFSFMTFDIDVSDTLYIYDGNSTLSPLIGKYNNTNPLSLPGNSVQASTSNITGEITFHFVSDNVVTRSGWLAKVECVANCQQIVALPDSSEFIPAFHNNVIEVCPGQNVKFVAETGPQAFPENDAVYHQDSTNCIFTWHFSDGTQQTGKTVWHSFPLSIAYTAILNITDTYGCDNGNFCVVFVLVSGDATADVSQLPQICASTDTTEVTFGPNSMIRVFPHTYATATSTVFDSSMFIPDGPACPTQCLEFDTVITNFTPGQIITSIFDIPALCITMEHSFAGDLGFWLTCPNGQQVMLDPNNHSGGAYLGEPMGGINHHTYDGANECDPAFNLSGTGWNYCWSEVYPQQGTLSYLDIGNSPIDSTDVFSNNNYLTPDVSFTSLIGCPMNGQWILKICDDYAVDNGWLFKWGIDFGNGYNTPMNYTVEIDSMDITGPFIYKTTDTSMFVVPITPGTYPYSLTFYDSFGCNYDTTISITYANCASVPENADKAFLLYPNPANESLTVFYPEYEKIKIQICDLTGRALLETQIQGGSFQVMDIHSLSAGIYQVLLSTNKTSIAKKLIIRK